MSLHCEATLLDFGSNTKLGTTPESYDSQPHMKSAFSEVADDYATIYGYESGKQFDALSKYGAGVFLRGPGHDGDQWKFYRVKMTACCYHNNLYPIPVTGVGPATIDTSDAGNQLSDFYYIGAPVSVTDGNSFHFDQLVKVKPFRTEIASRPICFGVVVYCVGGTRGLYHYSVSVVREDPVVAQTDSWEATS